MSAVVKEHAIPQGAVKILNISDISWDKRYREEFGDLEDLAASMKEKGVLQPITVSTDMKLLAGERRIRAATLAGLTKIPALVRKVDGELDAREIELIENVFRKDFSWPEECALIQEIDRLYKEKNIDWSGRKTAQLLNKGVASVSRALKLAHAVEAMPELSEYKTADEAMKVIKKLEENVVVQELRARQVSPSNLTLDKGIKAMLDRAEHNYIVGDTFKGLAELRSNGVVSVIECDPPYGINLTVNKRSKESVTSTVHSYNEVPAEEYQKFLDRLAKELFRVAGQHCWLIFWFGPTWHREVLDALRNAGWLVDDIPGIWVKRHGQTMQPELYLARGYEPFFVARKGQPALIKRGRLNVFDFPGVQGTVKYHPTERPVPLIEALLETFAVARSTVLVPFLGSGATIRAAYNLGMNVFGWDISGEYKDKLMLALEEDAKKLDAEEE